MLCSWKPFGLPISRGFGVRKIIRIIVHCAATPADVSARTIDKWHKARGWSGIGYHHVIRRDGTIEPGRPPSKIGAHTKGNNRDSIGICLAGGKNAAAGLAGFTDAQLLSLRLLIGGYEANLEPMISITGHNDYTRAKTCPNFDVAEWWWEVCDKPLNVVRSEGSEL